MTNFIFIKRLPKGKDVKELVKTLVDHPILYKNLIHTSTTDKGPEFAEHPKITGKLQDPIYFAHPYCSCEKGALEHAHKLIRQFIPNDTNLKKHSQKQLTEIRLLTNKRPPKKPSPKEIIYNFKNRNFGGVAFET